MHKRRLLHILIFFAVLTMLLAGNVSLSTAASIGGGSQDQTNFETLNLLILVKASKISNAPINEVEGNAKSSIEVIQDSIKSIFEEYQFPPNVNVGVMVFGHEIGQADSASCSEKNVELVIPFQPASRNLNLNSFTSIFGLGHAPTTIALKEAGKEFPQDITNVLNAVLLISDGPDSCESNPENEAAILADRQNVVIYTIGLLPSGDTATELETIANRANGKYSNVPTFLSGDSQRVTSELTGLITIVLDELTAQVPVPNPTEILTSLVEIQPSTTQSPLPFSTIVPTSLPPVETSDSIGNWLSSGILVVAIVGLIIFVIFGFLYLRPRLTDYIGQDNEKILKNKAETINHHKIERPADEIDISTIDWDVFLQDIYKAYSSVGQSNRYISLDLLKQELSNKYTRSQFNDILMMARQKHPNNIWVDKDSKGKTIVKIVL